MTDIIGIGIRDALAGRSQNHMDASSEQVPSRWSERTIGERAVIAAWRAVAAHLAADAVGPGSPAEQQVASGGAGVDDGVTEDALPPVLRKRAG